MTGEPQEPGDGIDPALAEVVEVADVTDEPAADDAELEVYRKASKGTRAGGRDDAGAGNPGNPPLPPCPVMALGYHADGIYFYATPSGARRALGYRSHRHGGLASIFDGDTYWLTLACPAGGRGGGFNEKWAAEVMMKAAVAAGYYDVGRDERGPGAWRLDDGALVLHLGDRLLLPAATVAAERLESEPAKWPAGYAWTRAGALIEGKFYPTARADPGPAATRASFGEMQELLAFIEGWNWRRPRDAARLLIGWLACALVCGALRWRPHIWVTGSFGSGKTALERLISMILGSLALRASAPTEFGLRDSLAGAARPLLLDELDTDGDPARVRDIVRLAKLASTEHQSPVVRGAEGRAKAWFIRAGVYLSSIRHAPLQPEDISRITVLELDELAATLTGAKAQKAFRKDLDRFGAFGPGLRARVLEAWPRFPVAFDVYRDALAKHGQTSRQIDQLGTLLAWADVVLSDGPPEASAVTDLVEAMALEELMGAKDDADHFRCLDWLLAWPVPEQVEIEGMTRHWTIGELVALSTPDDQQSEAARTLRRYGVAVRIAKDHLGAVCLVVANRNPGLERVFQGDGMRWSRGVWSQSLRRLPFAWAGPQVKFGGRTERCNWIAAVENGIETAETVNPVNPASTDGEI